MKDLWSTDYTGDDVLCSCASGVGKNAHLTALEGSGERLQLVKADILDYSSVESAIAGCEGVFHVASPVPYGKPSDPEVILLIKFDPCFFLHFFRLCNGFCVATFISL